MDRKQTKRHLELLEEIAGQDKLEVTVNLGYTEKLLAAILVVQIVSLFV